MTAIVLFDGECNFCDASVQFIIARDPKVFFQFAALQSDIGRELKIKHLIPEKLNSVLVIEDNTVYDSSDAAIFICKHLKGLWKVFYVFKIIPKTFRDILYKFVANNRYKWFGKKESCTIPSPEMRNRFL
ncbi:DCC1-like thiol-disulfide oxidoreductase family protein [Bacillus sp. Cr_A10]|uniref:thiol-disulfide oxidoreductase DCC family protein n=1 Tax=Bacillus sp. Cr_A10 TaxID=3033993 RepID=UPI0023DBF768|nr:DCC1-like thiol-disulfide oxidoreductase family protein [Bacillus sp. Cr_A10]MDF2065388.1 DCC1-like thiol-disulfide oxidoreductase family protein [Bacillus sp. Cr_A10]